MPAQHNVQLVLLHYFLLILIFEHMGANKYNAFFGYCEPLGVVRVIFPDDRMIRNMAALVYDGPGDEAFFTDFGAWKNNGLKDFGSFIHFYAGKQQRLPHTGA